MTLRGLSRWSCTLVTGREATWCAAAFEHRHRALPWLWVRIWGFDHCKAEHLAFYEGRPYRETPLFR